MNIKIFLIILNFFSLYSIFLCANQQSTSYNLKTINIPCNLKRFKDGNVCVCTEKYCDFLDFPMPTGEEFAVISSSKSGLRFNLLNGFVTNTNSSNILYMNTSKAASIYRNARQRTLVPFVYKDSSDVTYQCYPIKRRYRMYDDTVTNQQTQNKQPNVTVTIDRTFRMQNITGFGATYTDATAYNIDKLKTSVQQQLYKSYFSAAGIQYTMLRQPIGGGGFGYGPWAYNEKPENDINLSNFTELDHRDKLKVAQFTDLMITTQNYDIKFIGCAWSPPPWMKSNNAWNGYSSLRKIYYETWVEYHLKYLRQMKSYNITFWAISTGNEMINGNLIFSYFKKVQSLGWMPWNLGDWLGNYFGPMIRSSEFKYLKIFFGDENRYIFPVGVMLMDMFNRNSVKYIDGFSKHSYGDRFTYPILQDITNSFYRNRYFFNTESGMRLSSNSEYVPLGSWDGCAKYAKFIFTNIHHWIGGIIDGNLVLDEKGGPNYVGEYTDAGIIINSTSGTEFYKQPIFYCIGHFSKFIIPNSIRISSKSTAEMIYHLAFIRPDSKIVVVLYNSDIQYRSTTLRVNDHLKGNIYITMERNSIHTVIYDAEI